MSSLRATLTIVGYLAIRTWKKTLRRPVQLSFSLAQPLIWMLFFGFLFQRFTTGYFRAGERYQDFLAPGLSAMSVLLGASQVGVTLLRDLDSGFLRRMLHTPTAPSTILFGKLLADALRLLVQAILVLGLGALLGARFHPSYFGVLSGLAALVLFAFALGSVSCWIALTARSHEGMPAFVHLVNMPLLFTSTALVPERHLPGWLAAIANYNPLTLSVDAWRGALTRGSLPSSTSLAVLLVLAALTFAIAVGAVSRVRSSDTDTG